MKRGIKYIALTVLFLCIAFYFFLVSPSMGVYYADVEGQPTLNSIEETDVSNIEYTKREINYGDFDIEKIDFLKIYNSVSEEKIIENTEKIKQLENYEENKTEEILRSFEEPSKDIKNSIVVENENELNMNNVSADDENEIIVNSEYVPKKVDNKAENITITYVLPTCEEVGAEMSYRTNMIARFVVPSQGINVAVFMSLSQQTCDNQDSAAYGHQNNNYILADHKHQAFSTLYYCYEGTLAYWITDTEIIEYVSEGVFSGHNTTISIVDEDYNLWPDVNGFVAYTCKDNWQNVAVVPFIRK